MNATDTFIDAQGYVVIQGRRQPQPIDMIRELRERLGMFAGAMSISPKVAWEQALERVDELLIEEGERR